MKILMFTFYTCPYLHTDSPPIFRKEPSSEAVKRNSRVKLKCKTDPKDADIRWVFNGVDVEDSEELGVSVRRGSLVIQAFQNELHQGDYQCIASNSAGAVISREAHIQVACKYTWMRFIRIVRKSIIKEGSCCLYKETFSNFVVFTQN